MGEEGATMEADMGEDGRMFPLCVRGDDGVKSNERSRVVDDDLPARRNGRFPPPPPAADVGDDFGGVRRWTVVTLRRFGVASRDEDAATRLRGSRCFIAVAIAVGVAEDGAVRMLVWMFVE